VSRGSFESIGASASRILRIYTGTLASGFEASAMLPLFNTLTTSFINTSYLSRSLPSPSITNTEPSASVTADILPIFTATPVKDFGSTELTMLILSSNPYQARV
jgi:hypothetical protein